MNEPSRPPKGPSQDSDSFILAWGIYGAVGFQLAATVVGGLLVGHWLDGKLGTTPWLALAGLTAGSIGGFYNLIRIIRWSEERKGK